MASDEYTIGWICALPIEKAAARGMLDEIHNTSFIRAASDKNSYTLGRIGPHNIVVASLPSGVYGETPAATVAAHMLASFKSVRIGLLVGIGGGIPSRSRDIRLGDVVVSRPEGTLGGVVQFDRGKTTAEGQFVRTGVLNKPPLVLLNALAELEAEHEMEGSKVPLYIAEMVDRYPRMRTDYSCQGPSNDGLYRSDYNHSEEHDSTCESCDPSEVVQRVERESEHPVIHYGIIASSNQVVKDAVLRDRIGAELGASCLEMEAAGIMDSFPCIVIRGVSDYADSHKNKRWQRYAAATAAAYAKELLHKVPPSELSAGPTALHLLRSGQSCVSPRQSLTYTCRRVVRNNSRRVSLYSASRYKRAKS
jgi:nucleoside phosphorylase